MVSQPIRTTLLGPHHHCTTLSKSFGTQVPAYHKFWDSSWLIDIHFSLSLSWTFCLPLVPPHLHLVFANTPSPPSPLPLHLPCHRYCSSIAAGTPRTHRTTLQQDSQGTNCTNIVANLALILQWHNNINMNYTLNDAKIDFSRLISHFVQRARYTIYSHIHRKNGFGATSYKDITALAINIFYCTFFLQIPSLWCRESWPKTHFVQYDR